MNAREICFAASFILLGSNPAFAWDGTNSNTGSSVAIERGQLVRTGRTVEVYDSTEGYKEDAPTVCFIERRAPLSPLVTALDAAQRDETAYCSRPQVALGCFQVRLRQKRASCGDF